MIFERVKKDFFRNSEKQFFSKCQQELPEGIRQRDYGQFYNFSSLVSWNIWGEWKIVVHPPHSAVWDRGEVVCPPASGKQSWVRSRALCLDQSSPCASLTATPCHLSSVINKQPTIHSGIKNVVKFKLVYLVINHILRVWRWAKRSIWAY